MIIANPLPLILIVSPKCPKSGVHPEINNLGYILKAPVKDVPKAVLINICPLPLIIVGGVTVIKLLLDDNIVPVPEIPATLNTTFERLNKLIPLIDKVVLFVTPVGEKYVNIGDGCEITENGVYTTLSLL